MPRKEIFYKNQDCMECCLHILAAEHFWHLILVTDASVQVKDEGTAAQEQLQSTLNELDRLHRDQADATAAHADVSVALVEARKQLSEIKAGGLFPTTSCFAGKPLHHSFCPSGANSRG